MAKTPRSKKAKGTRFEKEVAKRLEDVLGDYGVEATRMVMSGAVDRFKGDIFTNLPLMIECKNQEKLSWWKAWHQADDTSIGSDKIPMLVVTRNFEENLCLLRFEDMLFFMELAIQSGWCENLRKTKNENKE